MRRGFALAEVLVAACLILGGLLVVLSFQGRSEVLLRNLEGAAEAAQIAAAELERIKAAGAPPQPGESERRFSVSGRPWILRRVVGKEVPREIRVETGPETAGEFRPAVRLYYLYPL